MSRRLNPKAELWFEQGNVAAAILGGPGFELIDRNWNAQDRLLIFGELFDWANEDPDRRATARRGIESALRIAVDDGDAFAAANIVWTYLITLRHFERPLVDPLEMVRILSGLAEEELTREGCRNTTAAIRGWLSDRGMRWPGEGGL